MLKFRIQRLLAISCCLVVMTGCSLMPEAIQPHQLWKLNRNPPPPGEDAYFSVQDLPAPTSDTFREQRAVKAANTMPTNDPFGPISD